MQCMFMEYLYNLFINLDCWNTVTTLNFVQSSQYSKLTFSHTTLSIIFKFDFGAEKNWLIIRIYMPMHPKQQEKTINIIIHTQT